MSKRKADKLKSEERETKKQKVTKEPRIEDVDMLLFIHGWRSDTKSLVWHFKPFWIVRWDLPQSSSWWARKIREWDEMGALDNSVGDEDFYLDKTFDTVDDLGSVLETCVYWQKGRGWHSPVTQEYLQELFEFLGCKSLATIVYEYMPIDGTIMSLKVTQVALGQLDVHGLHPEFKVTQEMGHPPADYNCSEEDPYGMCWCRTYARRVFIPERVGYDEGKLLQNF